MIFFYLMTNGVFPETGDSSKIRANENYGPARKFAKSELSWGSKPTEEIGKNVETLHSSYIYYVFIIIHLLFMILYVLFIAYYV